MDECWDERYLHRKIQSKDGEHHQYYAYALEAVLILSNGMVLPLMSEFLENSTDLITSCYKLRKCIVTLQIL
ncbi:MAG: hypothetical protein RJR35_09750 [Thermoanaerobacterales bacterium]|nr:hypothetical protein [Thermoanaerobacterales bacterium]